jgi:3'(2'), 5'-bisphosphate nucleotidase
MNIEIDILVNIAYDAGKAIMEIYSQDDFSVEYKDDNSPLTKADKAAHEIIIAGLRKVYPSIPVISEEAEVPQYSQREKWERFFLIDPLDGTKEFINRNGDFTVNIALIEDRQPVAGVVFAPALEKMYYALKGKGAWRSVAQEKAEKLPVDGELSTRPENGIRVVASKSHMNSETEEFIRNLYGKFAVVDTVQRGSSLKICSVAEGSADVYPRMGPTMEWDVAAGHAIAAEVLGQQSVEGLEYNKEDLHNSFFIVSSMNYQ